MFTLVVYVTLVFSQISRLTIEVPLIDVVFSSFELCEAYRVPHEYYLALAVAERKVPAFAEITFERVNTESVCVPFVLEKDARNNLGTTTTATSPPEQSGGAFFIHRDIFALC